MAELIQIRDHVQNKISQLKEKFKPENMIENLQYKFKSIECAKGAHVLLTVTVDNEVIKTNTLQFQNIIELLRTYKDL